MSRGIARMLAIPIALVLVLGACASEAPGSTGAAVASGTAPVSDADAKAALVAKAKADGQVNWYTIMQTVQAESLAKEFEKQYGIRVEITRDGSPAIVQKYQLEWESSVHADVFMASDAEVFNSFADKGMLQALNSPNGQKLQPSLRDPQGRWFAEYVQVYIMGYQQKKLGGPDVPKAWKDLTQPKYKNELTVSGRIATGAVFMTITQWYKLYGPDFFKGLAANNPVNVDDNNVIINMVAAGEKSILMAAPLHLILPQASKGVMPIWPEEGPLLNPVPVAVSPKAPHPNAAALFLDWLLSVEAQTKFVTESPGVLSANPTVPRTGGIPDLPKTNTPDFEYVKKNRDAVWAAWSSALGFK